jgi:hypothetical protein
MSNLPSSESLRRPDGAVLERTRLARSPARMAWAHLAAHRGSCPRLYFRAMGAQSTGASRGLNGKNSERLQVRGDFQGGPLMSNR